MTILLVCSDEQRLNRLKDAIHSAGFRTISAQALDAAWTRTDFFDFGAVVIDYELKGRHRGVCVPSAVHHTELE